MFDYIFIVLSAVIMGLITHALIFTMIKRNMHALSYHRIGSLLDVIYLPLQILIIVCGLFQVLHVFEYNVYIRLYIDQMYKITVLLFLCWFLIRFKKRFEASIIEYQKNIVNQFDPALVPIISQITKFFVLFCMVMIGLSICGIPLQSLMLLQGAVSIALGVSAQNILSNGFAGLVLLWSRPFKVGDLISSPDKKIEGYVQEIRWDSTKILTIDGKPVIVPNSLFSHIILVNSSTVKHKHITQTLYLDYHDIDKVNAITVAIKEMLQEREDIEQKLKISAYLSEIGTYALKIQVSAFTKSPKTALFQSTQQDICIQIMNIIQNHQAHIVQLPVHA